VSGHRTRWWRAAGALVLFAAALAACDPDPIGSVVGPLDFEAPRYAVGDIDGQDGWLSTGQVDHAVDDQAASGTRPADWGFGAQSLRMSNAVASATLAEQTSSKPTGDHSGEVSNGDVGGTRRGFFEANWSFATAGDPAAEQEDLVLVASPDRGDGSPMSGVAMADCSAEHNAAPPFCLADGLEVDVEAYDAGAGAVVTRNVASGLSRLAPHAIRLRMFFYDGAGNDVVEVCVDGTRCVATGSWEDLYRAGGGGPHPVDSVLFHADGAAAPATAGDGFFVDDFVARSVTHTGADVAVTGPAKVVEGASGTTAATYTITLSEPLPITVQVPYRTTDGTATMPADYAATSGTATFAPGETTKVVEVSVNGDTADETHERFSLDLGDATTEGRGPGRPSGAYVYARTAKATTTIADDDSTVGIDDVTVDEPLSGTTPMRFTVTLANPSAVPVTILLSTADGPAVAPGDYTARSNVAVTFDPGTTRRVVKVAIRPDALVEGPETLTAGLHDATMAVIGDALGVGTIRDARPFTRPNVVVVMTDDQTSEQMRFLPRTEALIGGEGTTFTNSFVNFPLCCPSRATFLTGQYMQNHGVDGNGPPPHGGYWDLDHTNTLPVWLRSSGYVTAHVGKYLNGYGWDTPYERPQGWTEWYGLVDGTPSVYQTYGYRMNRNGVLTQYGSAEADYQTDVIADTAVDVINRRAPGAAPFLLYVAPTTPHRENTPTGSTIAIEPAPRHKGTYSALPLPRAPSFNEADVSDKPASVRNQPLLSAGYINQMTSDYRHQAEALLAVDEMVERIYRALEASGELDNTVIVFTSDNGYFHGQHRMPGGKGRVYEEDQRVPLLVRGPGFAAGTQATEPVVNADLAPTIVGLAGATPGRVMDGRSLLDRDPDRPLLFQAAYNVVESFTAVRTTSWEWVEYSGGDRELYDVVNDPYQLTSRHADPALANTRTQLAALLARLRACAGVTCRSP
jgi:arylsulfatase A-like enzyme